MLYLQAEKLIFISSMEELKNPKGKTAELVDLEIIAQAVASDHADIDMDLPLVQGDAEIILEDDDEGVMDVDD